LSLSFVSLLFNNLSPACTYTLSLHDALPILPQFKLLQEFQAVWPSPGTASSHIHGSPVYYEAKSTTRSETDSETKSEIKSETKSDRKSTRLNSSHLGISYAVFCLKKKKKKTI